MSDLIITFLFRSNQKSNKPKPKENLSISNFLIPQKIFKRGIYRSKGKISISNLLNFILCREFVFKKNKKTEKWGYFGKLIHNRVSSVKISYF